MSRHILIDENIPLAQAAFSHLGSVERFSGRALSKAQIDRADALIVRSITPVDGRRLQGTKISFVGTCTIGTDHLALDELHSMGVTTASAPSCNANSVVEYVLTALVAMKKDWLDKKCMVIGCGNVGDRLAQRLNALGADVIGYDPFLSPAMDRPYLTDFSAIVDADIICLHTPYTQKGQFPTHHLLNDDVIAQLKPNAVLINAGRGGAIDNSALLNAVNCHKKRKVALDVWEHEPYISQDLMKVIDLATPHIAGYSWDGKAKGTWQIALALENHWQQSGLTQDGWQKQAPAPVMGKIVLAECVDELPSDAPYLDFWQKILTKIYDITADDSRLREVLGKHGTQPNQNFSGLTPFDYLRKTYPVRREWPAFTLDFSGWAPSISAYRQRLWNDATIMGFQCL